MSYFITRKETPTKAELKAMQLAAQREEEEEEVEAGPEQNGAGAEMAEFEQARHACDAAVTAKTVETMQKLRLALKKRGTHGIITLGRKFKSMDDDNSGSLDYMEFKKAMKEMEFNEGETQALFRFFDRDCNGFLSYDEFITGLRGSLNERRQELVFMAFKVLDKSGDGIVDVQDLVGRYDASKHPDVLNGTKTKLEVLREFMDVFDGGEKDGIITPEEFAQYYSSVSANIDSDDYFELMIRNAWHISGGEGWCENTTCTRVLVTHEDGTQTVEEIKNDFDIAKDDEVAMKKNLADQGIHAAALDTTGKVDKPTPTPPSDKSRRSSRSDLQDNRARMTQSSITF